MFSEILTPYRAGILLFIAILGLILWKDRENIEFHSIIFIRRTRKGIEFIKRTASKFPKFWKGWSTTGVVISVLVSIAGFFFLGFQVLKSLMTSQATPAVGLVLPTFSQTPSMSPGLFFIPFWYWIIGVGTVAAVHELMHGVIGINEGFNIKSVGWFILLIIPGAFVEPEGEEMLPEEGQDTDKEDGSASPWGEGPVMGKLRVLAAGSWSNLCVAVILLLGFLAITTPSPGYREVRGVYQHEGVRIAQVANSSPAEHQGFRKDMVIQEIGGREVMDIRDFSEATEDFEPGKTILIGGENGSEEFLINATLGTQNRTSAEYKPSVLERGFIRLEEKVPGSYTNYIKLQDALTGSTDTKKIARWRWVKNSSETLAPKAEERIRQLESSVSSESFLGVSVLPERSVRDSFENIEFMVSPLMNLVLFLIMIHSGVGFANLLPIKPLDGGWIVDELFREYRPEWENAPRYISIVTVSFFILSLALPMVL